MGSQNIRSFEKWLGI